MLVQGLDLNDLLALPTGRKHRALFPVMYIDGIFIEIGVKLPTEVASVIVFLLHLLVLSGGSAIATHCCLAHHILVVTLDIP